jgi:hypothetical protein
MIRRPKKAAKTSKTKTPRRKARTAAPKGKREPLDDFIAASASVLGLKIDDSWMPAVRIHLAVTLAYGARVAEFALPDDAEPASVFQA